MLIIYECVRSDWAFVWGAFEWIDNAFRGEQKYGFVFWKHISIRPLIVCNQPSHDSLQKPARPFIEVMCDHIYPANRKGGWGINPYKP